MAYNAEISRTNNGMFVPRLEGMSSYELGHLNYQHPRRTENDFGPHLDNFSAWVIYVSLMALSLDKNLWKRAGAGDDFLLFCQKDFARHNTTTTLFSELKQTREGRLPLLASQLLTLTNCMDLAQIPPPGGAPATQFASPMARCATLPGWLTGRLHLRKAPEAQPAPEHTPAASPPWILDHLEATPAASTVAPRLKERLFLGTFAVLVCFLVATAASGLVNLKLAAPAISCLFALIPPILIYRFRCLPEVYKKLQLQATARSMQYESRRLEGAARRISEAKNKLDEEEKQKKDKIAARQNDLKQKKKRELDRIDDVLKTILTGINARRQAIRQAEACEIADALHEIQGKYLPQKLQYHEISRSTIKGIGPGIKKRLLAAGIRTAADIAGFHIARSKKGRVLQETAFIEIAGRGRVHIEGIGPKKAQDLMVWRRSIESAVKSQMPKSIPAAQEMMIKSKFQARMQSIDSQESAARKEARKKKAAVQAMLRQENNALKKLSRGSESELYGQRQDFEQKLIEVNTHLNLKNSELALARQELALFRQVSFKAYIKRILFLQEK